MTAWVLKIWLKRFLSARLYVIVAALAIAFAVGLAVCLMSLSRDLTQALTAELKAKHGGDIVVTWNPAPNWPSIERMAGETAARNGEGAADLNIVGRLRAQDPLHKGSYVVVRGVTPRYPLYGTVRLEEPQGAELALLLQEPGAVVVSRTLAERLRLGVGDELALGAAGDPHNVRVAGIVADDGRPEQDASVWGYALVDMSAAREILSPAQSLAQLRMGTSGADETELLAATLRQELADADVSTLAQAAGEQQGEIASLNFYFYLLAVMAFIVCVASVATMVWFQISRDLEALAVVRCLGLKPAGAACLIFVQISILALGGGLVGALAGEALSLAAAPALAASYHTEIDPAFHLDIFLLGLLLAFVFAHIAGLLPLWASVAAQPMRTLRQTAGSSAGIPVRKPLLAAYLLFLALAMALALWLALGNFSGFVVGVALAGALAVLALAGSLLLALLLPWAGKLGALFSLALANIKTYRFRSTAAVLGVATSTLILTTLFGGVAAIKGSMIKSAASSFDLLVEAPLASYQEEAAAIGGISGVARVDISLGAPAVIETAEGVRLSGEVRDRSPGINGVVNREGALPPLIAGEGLAEAPVLPGESKPVLVSQKTAASQNIGLGDRLEVGSQEQRLHLIVRGIYQHLPISLGDALIVRADDLPQDLWRNSLLLVRSDGSLPAAALAHQINEQRPRAFAYSTEQLLPVIDTMIASKWYPAIGLGLLASWAGLVACLSSVVLSLSQHSRDFGVLKALGGNSRLLYKLVGYEYALLATSGAVGGAVLGSALLYGAGWLLLQEGEAPSAAVVIAVVLSVIVLVELLALALARLWFRSRPAELLRAG